MRGQASVLVHLGNAYWEMGQHAQALQFLGQAYRLWQELGEEQGQWRALNAIGLVWWEWGEYEKALGCHRRAYELAQQSGDRQREGMALSSLGFDYWGLGANSQALECYKRAYEIAKEVGHKRDACDILNLRAAASQQLGQFNQALEEYQQAYLIAQELRGSGASDSANIPGLKKPSPKPTWREAQILNNLGDLYLDLGQPQKALEHLQQAQRIIERLQLKDLQIENLFRRSLAHLLLQQISEACACSLEAVELLEGGQVGKEKRGSRYPHPQLVYFAHFKALRAEGRKEALIFLEKARREILRRANKIRNPVLRQSFLQVRWNRQILEEALLHLH